MSTDDRPLGRPVLDVNAITQEGVAGTVVGWNADSPANDGRFESTTEILHLEIEPSQESLVVAFFREWQATLADSLAVPPGFLLHPADSLTDKGFLKPVGVNECDSMFLVASGERSDEGKPLKMTVLKDRPSAEGCTVLTYEVSFAYGLYEKQDPPVEPSP